jgi:urea transporter
MMPMFLALMAMKLTPFYRPSIRKRYPAIVGVIE